MQQEDPNGDRERQRQRFISDTDQVIATARVMADLYGTMFNHLHTEQRLTREEALKIVTAHVYNWGPE